MVVLAIPEHSQRFSKWRQQILNKAKAYAKDHGLDWDGLAAEDKMPGACGAKARDHGQRTDQRRRGRDQPRGPRAAERRGEIGDDEVVYRAIDQDGRIYGLPIASGDRVPLFRRTWGTV